METQVPVPWVLCATVISLIRMLLKLKSLLARMPNMLGDMLSTTMRIHLQVSTVTTKSMDVPLSSTMVRMMKVMADSHAQRQMDALDQESGAV